MSPKYKWNSLIHAFYTSLLERYWGSYPIMQIINIIKGSHIMKEKDIKAIIIQFFHEFNKITHSHRQSTLEGRKIEIQ